MTPTIDVTAPANLVTETLLTGNITFNLVAMIFTCISIAVVVTLWVVYKFQTKEDALASEARLKEALDDEATDQKAALEATKVAFAEAITGIHAHMSTMKKENKDDVQQMQAEISGVRTVLTTMAGDLGYLRAKAEPKG